MEYIASYKCGIDNKKLKNIMLMLSNKSLKEVNSKYKETRVTRQPCRDNLFYMA